MRYANEKIEREWNNPLLDDRVIEIALWFDNYCELQYGTDTILTSIFRTWGSGVHEAWRAIDVGSNAFTYSQCIEIRNAVNKKFPRLGIFKTCVYHNSGFGWHFHLQVGWLKAIPQKNASVAIICLLVLGVYLILKILGIKL